MECTYVHGIVGALQILVMMMMMMIIIIVIIIILPLFNSLNKFITQATHTGIIQAHYKCCITGTVIYVSYAV